MSEQEELGVYPESYAIISKYSERETKFIIDV